MIGLSTYALYSRFAWAGVSDSDLQVVELQSADVREQMEPDETFVDEVCSWSNAWASNVLEPALKIDHHFELAWVNVRTSGG